MAVVVAFAGLVIAYFLGLVTHALLFELAGAGFFLAYVLAALADAKLARKPHGRFFGMSVANHFVRRLRQLRTQSDLSARGRGLWLPDRTVACLTPRSSGK